MASILEIPLDDVPAFGAGTKWFATFREWLGERNLTAFVWPYIEGGWKPSGYAILGLTPHGSTCGHEVVALNGEIVHDPWPTTPHGGGYASFDEWTVFGILDPAQRSISDGRPAMCCPQCKGGGAIPMHDALWYTLGAMETGAEYTARDMARCMGTGDTAMSNRLEDLRLLGHVARRKLGRSWLYRADGAASTEPAGETP